MVEQIPLSKESVDALLETKFKGEPVDVSELYRWKEILHPTSYAHTSLSHGDYFFSFLIIIAYHAYIDGVKKY